MCDKRLLGWHFAQNTWNTILSVSSLGEGNGVSELKGSLSARGSCCANVLPIVFSADNARQQTRQKVGEANHELKQDARALALC